MPIQGNVQFSSSGVASPSVALLEQRLKSALSNLRAQIRRRSESNEPGHDEYRPSGVNQSIEREISLNRSRELHKLLMKSRTREADLQDEVDGLKAEMADDRYRIEELEGLVDEWRRKYECLLVQMDDSKNILDQQLEEKCIENVQLRRVKENFETSGPVTTTADRKATSVVVLDNDECRRIPSRPTTPLNRFTLGRSPSLASSVIPDISRVFSTARSPCLFKL